MTICFLIILIINDEEKTTETIKLADTKTIQYMDSESVNRKKERERERERGTSIQ